MKSNPPYPPLSGGQEKPKPLPPRRGASPCQRGKKKQSLLSLAGAHCLFLPPCQGGVGGVGFAPNRPPCLSEGAVVGGMFCCRGRIHASRPVKTFRRVCPVRPHRFTSSVQKNGPHVCGPYRPPTSLPGRNRRRNDGCRGGSRTAPTKTPRPPSSHPSNAPSPPASNPQSPLPSNAPSPSRLITRAGSVILARWTPAQELRASSIKGLTKAEYLPHYHKCRVIHESSCLQGRPLNATRITPRWPDEAGTRRLNNAL